MNKEQIIDEAYENYRKTILTEFFENTKELRKWAAVEGPGGYNKEEFIDRCKTDSDFSETWGLKIEERELSLDERNEIRDIQYFKNNLHQALKGSDTKIDWENIPTKLITLTYNNETLESYEI